VNPSTPDPQKFAQTLDKFKDAETLPEEIDGVVEQATRPAVVAFQASRDMPQTGQLDDERPPASERAAVAARPGVAKGDGPRWAT
jgi:peptidoglycan hydrolase-like protein with peptidoglycan-binding domain